MKNLKKGDKIRRINTSYMGIKPGDICTFTNYSGSLSLKIKEEPSAGFMTENFERVSGSIGFKVCGFGK